MTANRTELHLEIQKNEGVVIADGCHVPNRGFWVLPGSKTPIELQCSHPTYDDDWRKKKVAELLADSIICRNNEHYEFKEEQWFSAITPATAFLSGYVNNKKWKTSNENTDERSEPLISEHVSPNTRRRSIPKPYSVWVEIHGPIPEPTLDEIEKYIKIWKGEWMIHYQEQEECIIKLFRNPDTKKRGQQNDPPEVILDKILMLNSFYSTKLKAPIHVLKHIEKIENFYADLYSTEDIKNKLVEEIAKGDINVSADDKYGDLRECFSFATKYCHHHNPEYFHIYDSYVAKVLRYFQQDFYPESLSEKKMKKEYAFFHGVLEKFTEKYELDAILEKLKKKYGFTSCNEVLDKYLWLLGKRYFQKPPKK